MPKHAQSHEKAIAYPKPGTRAPTHGTDLFPFERSPNASPLTKAAATWRRVALPRHRRVKILQLSKLKFRCSGLVRNKKNTNHIWNLIGNDISDSTVKAEFPFGDYFDEKARDGHEHEVESDLLRQPALCQHAGVPQDAMKDIEVNPSSSTDIRHREAEYTREEAPGTSSAEQPTKITQDMILKMGHLAHSADERATLLEVAVPSCEHRQGKSSEVTTLKAEVANMIKDIDYLKSTDFNSLLKAANDVNAQHSSEIPPITTKNMSRDDVVVHESEIETDEEQIEVSIYGDLPNLEESIVLSVI
ncbi:hypothetical protein H5410_004987 [Solanum commersonii]|uniref:Polyprotein protein n=1 Tax=Solanum commersonii TaxID=4109 RepID=A0A9J6A5E8_SOLCO|nr:hypothetical protein H5410_004987 [Solanum commersonii]